MKATEILKSENGLFDIERLEEVAYGTKRAMEAHVDGAVVDVDVMVGRNDAAVLHRSMAEFYERKYGNLLPPLKDLALKPLTVGGKKIWEYAQYDLPNAAVRLNVIVNPDFDLACAGSITVIDWLSL